MRWNGAEREKYETFLLCAVIVMIKVRVPEAFSGGGYYGINPKCPFLLMYEFLFFVRSFAFSVENHFFRFFSGI